MRARENPFRTELVRKIRYRPLEGTWHEMKHRLKHLHFRGSIVGPHGSGKTTLLEDLRHHLEGIGFQVHWLRLDEANPRFPRGFLDRLSSELSSHDCILFDGAEQLNWWKWRRFTKQMRRAGGLIITTHRLGRLPLLLQCRTTPELLRDMAAHLLGATPESVDQEARELHHKHDGNIREALREWYDRQSAGTLRA